MKQHCQYLIVDDDNTSNLICEFTIRRFNENAVIHLFTKPEEALQFIQDKKHKPESGFTILFLDVNMPAMTGFEFLEEVEKLQHEAKEKIGIYLLTSSSEDLSTRAREFPIIKGFLQKPIKISYLQQINQGL